MHWPTEVAGADDKLEFPDLDPFNPPANFSFEPELCEPVPREISDETRHYKALQLRRMAIRWAAAGMGLVVLAILPAVREWAVMVPALDWLSWIGAGMMGIAALLELYSFNPLIPKAKFVRFGTPVVARICKLWLQPTTLQNGAPTKYGFFAVIEHFDEMSGELHYTRVASRKITSGDRRRLETTYRVGDYATALVLPAPSSASIQLYGFLDMKPGLGLVERGAIKGSPTSRRVTAMATVLALVGLVGWAIICFQRFEPLDRIPREVLLRVLAVGSTLSVIVAYTLASLFPGREAESVRERNALAAASGGAVELTMSDIGSRWWAFKNDKRWLVVLFGPVILLFGNIAFIASLWGVNAVFDDSQGMLRPIQIMSAVNENEEAHHIPLYRGATIHYRLAEGGCYHRFHTTPDALAQFEGGEGIARVRQGYLGWRWVDEIRPVKPREDIAREGR